MDMASSYFLVFANLAGAAREIQADPAGLGRFIWRHPVFKQGKVLFVGLTEVVRPGAQMLLDQQIVPLQPGHIHSTHPDSDDLFAFAEHGGDAIVGDYLAHLASTVHINPAAIANKWQQESRGIRAHVQQGGRINQGSAVLIPQSTRAEVQGHLIRYPGERPETVSEYDALAYLGNRDSEPRAAIVGRISSEDIALCVASTQLETNSDDVIGGRRQPTASLKGRSHRQAQLARVVEALSALDASDSGEPKIVLGDFNTVVESEEIQSVIASGYHYPEHAGVVLPDGRFDPSAACYTHLKHRLLIDFALVRDIPEHWELRQFVLAYPDEACSALSDHRVAVVEIRVDDQS